MIPHNPSQHDSQEDSFPVEEIKDNGVDYFPWEDADDKGIDWGKVTLEGEPYDGPPGDASVYSDLEDVSQSQDKQKNNDAPLSNGT